MVILKIRWWLFIATIFFNFDVVAQIVDSTGSSVQLKKSAQRIISLAPNLTETLYAVGAGRQIIARDRYSDYPANAKNLPIVGNYFKLNIEGILRLNPDLIVLERSAATQTQLRQLKNMGIAIYINDAPNLSSILKTIQDLGYLSGHAEIAHKMVHRYKNQLSRYRAQGTKCKPIVFYEFWHQPVTTVNNQTVIGEAIAVCGGINPFGKLRLQNPTVSLESVIKVNPDIIITNVPHAWQRWSFLKAVQHHMITSIPNDLINRTGPRLFEGIDQLCQLIATQQTQHTYRQPKVAR